MSSAFRNFFSKCSSAYKKVLVQHPYATQAVQVSVLMGTGDVIAQIAVDKKRLQEINLHRTSMFAGLGLFLVGPTLRYWYGQLDRFVKIDKPFKRTIVKMCLDQGCFAPTFLFIFTSALSALQGMNAEEIVNRLKKDYVSVLITNYTIWPGAQLINFGFIPLNCQVIFVQCVAIVWNTYLSAKLGSGQDLK